MSGTWPWQPGTAARAAEEAREMIAVFSTGEQQELRKIEDGLRAQDRGFTRRLARQQSVLRWAAPGRPGFLLALASAVVAAVALLAFGTVVTRRLLAAGRAALMRAFRP